MNKSMVVAKADLKMAMQVRFVKFGIIMAASFGPLMAILLFGALIIMGIPAAFFVELISILGSTITIMLAIFAIIPSTMISANALVGEREQRTLEPLLCTPLTDQELLYGKLLSSAIPCLAILVSSVLITMVASIGTSIYLGLGIVIVPDLPGLVLLFVGVPFTILAVVAVMILISGKVSRVYEAYQMTGAIVLIFIFPMMVPWFSIDPVTGLIDQNLVWITNIITIMISVVLFAITWTLAVKQFNRDKMVSLV